MRWLPDHLAHNGNPVDEREADAAIKAACAKLHELREFREDKVSEYTPREYVTDFVYRMGMFTEVSG